MPNEKRPAHLILMELINESIKRSATQIPSCTSQNLDLTSGRDKLRIPGKITDENLRKMFEEARNIEIGQEEKRTNKQTTLKILSAAFEILQRMLIIGVYRSDVVIFMEEIRHIPLNEFNDHDVYKLIASKKTLDIAFVGSQPWHRVALEILKREFETLTIIRTFDPDYQADSLLVAKITSLLCYGQAIDSDVQEIIFSLKRIQAELSTYEISATFVKAAIYDLTDSVSKRT